MTLYLVVIKFVIGKNVPTFVSASYFLNKVNTPYMFGRKVVEYKYSERDPPPPTPG